MIDIFAAPDPPKPRTPNEWMRLNFPTLTEIYPFPFVETSSITQEIPMVEVQDIDESAFTSIIGPLGNPQRPAVCHDEQFYRFSPGAGIYEELYPDRIMAEWGMIIDRCASSFGEYCNVQSFQRLKQQRILGRALRRAKELLKVKDDFFDDASDRYLPLQNGILDTKAKVLLPFTPDLRFTHSLPVQYNPDAKPDHFLGIFKHVLSPDDLDLLQQYLGLLLLPKNYAQRILIIGGDAGWGKGTLLRLIERVLGTERIGLLREKLFTDRYELARLKGKRLLVAPDCPTDLMNTPKAAILKQLVGSDLVCADVRKGDPIQMHGNFAVIVCCNGKPRIPIDDDVDAWMRRLAMIEVKKPKGAERMGKLSEILGDVESGALLNWMLEGRERVIQNAYQLHLSHLQEQRVMQLVRNSQSDSLFLDECLVEHVPGEIAGEDVRKAYVAFCRDNGFAAVKEEGFTRRISEGIRYKWGIHERHDVQRQGKARRGWRGLRFRAKRAEGVFCSST